VGSKENQTGPILKTATMAAILYSASATQHYKREHTFEKSYKNSGQKSWSYHILHLASRYVPLDVFQAQVMLINVFVLSGEQYRTINFSCFSLLFAFMEGKCDHAFKNNQ